MRTCLAAAALVVGLAACSPGSAGAPSALTSVGATTSSAGGTTGDPAPPGSCHAGDGGFLPDPGCTPGGADARVTPDTLSSTICRSGYTATVRPPLSVTEPIKRERMAAYGLSAPLSAYELDHLVPLELGGASTVANLWPEPWADPRGAHRKDDLENALKRQVCSGTLSLADARHAIASDWESAYRTYVGGLP
jgi:hypothetical protein